jgi:LuxR family maltose regulon positive regulatory protein
MPQDARNRGTRLERLASPLLRAKLRPPLAPKHHVRRERLLRLLDEAVCAPLRHVVAPAGVGKTLLVSSWAAEPTVPTSWLTLGNFPQAFSHLALISAAADITSAA